MLEPTKKRPTEFTVLGPAERLRELENLIQPLGFSILSKGAFWRDAFPEVEQAMRPGVNLAGLRHREGLTQAELARRTGIPQRHISEMENHKRVIGAQRAKLLGKALGADYRLFL